MKQTIKLSQTAISELRTLIEYAIYDTEYYECCEDEGGCDCCINYTQTFKEEFGISGYDPEYMTDDEFKACTGAVQSIKDVWNLTPPTGICCASQSEHWARVGTGLVNNLTDYIINNL